MSAPLAGVRVLDLSRLLPGGAATRLLAVVLEPDGVGPGPAGDPGDTS